MEERAFEALWQFYLECSGRYRHDREKADLLCRDYDVALVECDFEDMLTAYLLGPRDTGAPDQWTIMVPHRANIECRGLLIYHELAHWRLWKTIPFFVRPRVNTTPEIDQNEEYWCEAFALAMLFAWAGREVLSAENYKMFFAAGTEAEAGSREYRYAIRGIYAGNRLHELNQKHFDPPHERFSSLADQMLIESARSLAGKKFWGGY